MNGFGRFERTEGWTGNEYLHALKVSTRLPLISVMPCCRRPSGSQGVFVGAWGHVSRNCCGFLDDLACA
jgi:hypothetical protein